MKDKNCSFGAKHISKSMKNTTWSIRSKSECAMHISKSKCTKHTSFGLLEVEMSKKCTPLWREAIRSQNTPAPDHCMMYSFGAKHISKWKCTKHTILGPLLRLRCRVSKKCTPLWREAHFQVKMYKTHHVRTTFGGWDVEFRKSARRCGAKHISKSKV